LKKKTKTDEISTKACCTTVDDMSAMTYQPNRNGPTTYFKAMVTARFEANALDKHGKISDGQLIMYAKRAFSQFGHAATHMTGVSTSWNKADNEYENQHPNTFLATRWSRFCVHYTFELKILHESTVTTPDHQANHTAELDNRINSLEIGNEQAHSNIDRLHSNMQILDDTRSIPGDIVTSGSTNGTVATTVAPITPQEATSIIGKAFQAYETKQNNDDNRGRNRGGDRGGDRSGRGRGRDNTRSQEWRQWKKWCWSCGVNLSHNSEAHRSEFRKLPGHNNTATTTNPLGGNIAKDGLWMKWWSPHDKEIHDTKG